MNKYELYLENNLISYGNKKGNYLIFDTNITIKKFGNIKLKIKYNNKVFKKFIYWLLDGLQDIYDRMKLNEHKFLQEEIYGDNPWVILICKKEEGLVLKQIQHLIV
jgi:hypothetical protein